MRAADGDRAREVARQPPSLFVDRLTVAGFTRAPGRQRPGPSQPPPRLDRNPPDRRNAVAGETEQVIPPRHDALGNQFMSLADVDAPSTSMPTLPSRTSPSCSSWRSPLCSRSCSSWCSSSRSSSSSPRRHDHHQRHGRHDHAADGGDDDRAADRALVVELLLVLVVVMVIIAPVPCWQW